MSSKDHPMSKGWLDPISASSLYPSASLSLTTWSYFELEDSAISIQNSAFE
jgi:hypothetical protein